MKRKLVEQGKTTLMISLPIDWIRKFNLEKGSEVELSEENGKLVINPSEPERKTIKFSLKGLESTLKPLVAAAYKSGFDELGLEYSDPTELKELRNLLDFTCMGYEIISQESGKVIIKNLMDIHKEDFHSILKREFLFLIANLEDCAEGLRKKDKRILEWVISRHLIINKYADLTRRLANNYPTLLKTGPLYYILEALEDISYYARNLSEYYSKNPKKIDSKALFLFAETIRQLKEFYNLFYSEKFDFIKNEKHFQEILNLINKVKETTKKSSKLTQHFLTWVDNILSAIRGMNGALMAIKLNEIFKDQMKNETETH